MAVYNPVQLKRQTAISFWCDNPEQLAAFLQTRGYHPIKPCQHEHARLEHLLGPIAVLYTSGVVLCQGGNRTHLIDLLQELVPRRVDLFGGVQ